MKARKVMVPKGNTYIRITRQNRRTEIVLPHESFAFKVNGYYIVSSPSSTMISREYRMHEQLGHQLLWLKKP